MFCAFKKIKYYFYFTLPKIALPPVADKSAVDFQVGRLLLFFGRHRYIVQLIFSLDL